MNLTVEDVKKIKNQDQLIEIAVNQELDDEIRKEAAKNIEDKTIFGDYAEDGDDLLRYYAARYADDDEKLLYLILNDYNDVRRHVAGMRFARICDLDKYGDALVEIALENRRYNAAPWTNPEYMARIACGRLNDPEKLMRIVKQSNNPNIFYKALDKINENDLYFLLNEDDLSIERALEIAMKLEDDEKLKELLKRNVWQPARFGREDSGDEIYANVVFSYPNEEIAIMALNKILHRPALRNIIENHENQRMRELARERLHREIFGEEILG